MLAGPEQPFVTLDPAAAKPALSVYALNYNKLDVKIYAVQPTDWPAFKQYLREWQRTDQPAQMPGKLLSDRSLPVEAAADTLTQVDIDLSAYLEQADSRFGHFVVVVSPPSSLFQKKEELYWRTSHTWVQVTQIGLDAIADHSEMVAWSTALKDGAPLAGVSIQPQSGAVQTTGADGTVRFSIPSGATYLVARQGADQALLPRSNYAWGDDAWMAYPPQDALYWAVFDDRAMYRPGEEVHLKGWLRRVGGRQDGDVGLVSGSVNGVTYQVMDAQGNEIGRGQAEVSALGGFDFAFTIPEAVNLGYSQVYLQPQGSWSGMDGGQFNHTFQIQEFRRPEFEVTARQETSGPYFAGGSAVLAVEAKYYAGDPLPNADTTWQVTYARGSYSPPNWPEFTFGTWQPWWGWRDFGIYPGGEVERCRDFQRQDRCRRSALPQAGF